MILDTSKKLILDADVIYHFTHAGKIDEIDRIFPNRLVISDTVCRELSHRKMYDGIGPLIRKRRVVLYRASRDYDLIPEYNSLKRFFGIGESMSMAYCKKYGESLASSNLQDIHLYCEANHIQYVTTLDFVHFAYSEGVWTLEESDAFISDVKKAGCKLPKYVNSIADYIPRITGTI